MFQPPGRVYGSYSFEEFLEYVRDGSFIDYDGIGYFVLNDTGDKLNQISCNVDWLNKYKPENTTVRKLNVDEFLKNTYELYIDVQNAWMNFDYDKLRSLLSDELYNTYSSQLKVLSRKKQKNIMSDFKLISHKIVFAEKQNDIYYLQNSKIK